MDFLATPASLLVRLPGALWRSLGHVPAAVPALGVAYVVARWFDYKWERANYWTWDVADPDPPVRKAARIDTSTDRLAKAFGTDFVWGVATAAHQVEGNCDQNNWWAFEHRIKPDGAPTILHGDKSGLACDHWNRYSEDIALIKGLGMTAYRFSIEWSKVVPVRGTVDADVIKHYHDVLDELDRQGIEPMITLHHFTNPIWAETQGSWEWDGMPEAFLEFVEVVFREFGGRCRQWVTFNEPEGYAWCGWNLGLHPPGKSGSFLGVVRVLSNILRAHVMAYKTMKAMPHGDKTMIGWCKSQFQFDPRNSMNPIEWIVAAVVDYMVNESLLNFFRNGSFRLLPFLPAAFYDPSGPETHDFVGLNYYSHNVLAIQAPENWLRRGIIATESSNSACMTDMHYEIYPEGFYRAIKQMATLGKPVIVTENGIADGEDSRRNLFIRRYLYAMAKAIEEGVDVRGYYYWTLMDNFEVRLGSLSSRPSRIDVDSHLVFYHSGPRAFLPALDSITRILKLRSVPCAMVPRCCSKCLPNGALGIPCRRP